MTGRGFSLTLLLLVSAPVWAATGDYPLQEVDISIDNRASLQRGAKYFVNYCLSCHSSRYARYKWVGRDLGLSEDMVRRNLIFTGQKLGDLMSVAMPVDKAQEWFGAPPPDLTLVARARGAAWVYTYLKSFYLDPKRPMGVNNLLSPGVSMPHVLWEMQGWQGLVEQTDDSGNTVKTLELLEPGKLSEEEYDKVIQDLVTFLVYLAEPAALERQRIGKWVILFLLALLGVSYFLYREYWREVN